MAHIARPDTDKAADAAKNARSEVAELGRKVADQAADQAQNVARGSFQAARQAIDAGREVGQKVAERAEAGVTEINQNLLQLVDQQAKDNVRLLQALAMPGSWAKAVQLQGEFLHASWQRAALFARRYVELSQTALSAARGPAGKA